MSYLPEERATWYGRQREHNPYGRPALSGYVENFAMADDVVFLTWTEEWE